MRVYITSWTSFAAVAAFISTTVIVVVGSESDWESCGFGKSLEEDFAKIKSYNVYHEDNHLQALFPKKKDPVVIPDLPVLVTAVASVNFLECMMFMRHMHDTKTKIPDLKIVIYNIGLKKAQITLIRNAYPCDIVSFSISDYPEHVKKMNLVAWKPIVIQLALNTYHYIVWVDTSVRLNANQGLETLFETGKRVGAMASYTREKLMIIHTTDKTTFWRFEENPCRYNNTLAINTEFLLLREQEKVLDYLMRPWVACALTSGCAQVSDSPGKRRNCPEVPAAYGCHQYDQSTFGVIFTRLFHRNITENIVPTRKYNLCKLKIKGNCYKP